MIIYIQNSEKNILIINKKCSFMLEDMKLLFEFTFIYEVFYCEKEIQKYFLIKLTDGILCRKWPFTLWIPQTT